MQTRWQFPEAGRMESEINKGLARDGISQRLCMHADRTHTTVDEGSACMVREECDYCPQQVTGTAGQTLPPMPPYYWRVP